MNKIRFRTSLLKISLLIAVIMIGCKKKAPTAPDPTPTSVPTATATPCTGTKYTSHNTCVFGQPHYIYVDSGYLGAVDPGLYKTFTLSSGTHLIEQKHADGVAACTTSIYFAPCADDTFYCSG